MMKSVIAFLVGAAVLAAPAMADLTGHTNLAGAPSWSGTNNWSVLSTVGDAGLVASLLVATGDVGLAAALAGPGEMWVYQYQITNDASSSVGLSQFTTNLGNGTQSYYAQYGGIRMMDAGGVVAPTNDLDGPLTGYGAGATHAAIGWGDNLAGSAAATFSVAGLGGTPLAAGSTSNLFVYVASLPPSMWTGSLQDGGQAVFGRSPAPTVPAPGAALLIGLGVGLVSWVKRRVS